MATKTTKTAAKTSSAKKADQYNDPTHNYLHYWDGRDYEHASEEVAIKRLLRGKTFKTAADIGGGYGRLCVLLRKYADKVTLAEPSQQQLDIAKDFLKEYPDVKRVLTQADNLKFKDKSLELITMIRVMHHIPAPETEFKELHRVLTDDGYLILEVANYAHGRNRIKHLVKGKRLPTEPVDIRTKASDIAFVNHNPKTVIRQLAHAGFKVEKVLSVSNLRSPSLKKVVPRSAMLTVEKFLQPTLARTYFGPSVFFLIKKAK
jgi:ubiquinone/menaquinone biosynthesis C-methylase UbiE